MRAGKNECMLSKAAQACVTMCKRRHQAGLTFRGRVYRWLPNRRESTLLIFILLKNV